MYRFVRNILFFLPAETAHYFSMNILKGLCFIGPIRRVLANIFSPTGSATSLATEFRGLRLRNQIGLGAGFDKNAKYLRELETLGFGFVEIGTVTPRPQAGNDKPRLFRLPADQALINRMGFNNDGVDVIAKRLKKWKLRRLSPTNGKLPLIVGGNIGKNKVT